MKRIGNILLPFFFLLFAPIFSSGQQIVPDAGTLQLLKIQLEKIADQDWYYRGILDSVRIEYHKSSPEYNQVCTQMDSADKVNQHILFPIIDKYGWLGKGQVGEKANDAIFKVVQHSHLVDQMKYVPLMKISVAKGESSELYLHWLEDRILLEQDKPTLYDTQGFDVPRKDGTVDFYRDRQKANEELKKEGLDTIPKDYNK